MGQTALETFYKKKKAICPPTEGNSGLTISHENGHILVYVDDAEELAPTMANTLIHESVHVFQEGMNFIGERQVGNECAAYSIAEIAENLMADYLKLKEHNALHERRQEGLQT